MPAQTSKIQLSTLLESLPEAIFIICAGGKCIDWGINALDGKKPFTFWLWEVDPANVYPKGLGVDLVPLQKRLNRLDSLMELGFVRRIEPPRVK